MKYLFNFFYCMNIIISFVYGFVVLKTKPIETNNTIIRE